MTFYLVIVFFISQFWLFFSELQIYLTNLSLYI